MTNFKTAALFTAFGFLLASLAGALMAAPDKTRGMALMSARVGGIGNLAGGAGAVSVEKVGPKGQYKVVFNRPLYPGCTLVASLATSGTGGAVKVNVNTGDGTAVVQTYDLDDNFEDRSFHLIAFCEG